MRQPRLNVIQKAWLQEIGVDLRLVPAFRSEQEPPPVAGSGDERSSGVQAQSVQEVEALSKRVVDAPPERRGEQGKGITRSAELPHSAPASTAIPSMNLAELRQRTEGCTACGLHQVRGRVVFGEGPQSHPRWMLVGEAPGEYDDSTGKPFQGRAGLLLNAMLASVGIYTQEVYFTNALKCRPLHNRSPEPSELATCFPVLREQIHLLRPTCLVALGRVAAATLVGGDLSLESLRGQTHEYKLEDGSSIPVVVTHHPATLLLHSALKAEAWRDLQLLRAYQATSEKAND